MSPLNRWKLISVVLAGCMSYTWWHGDAASEPPASVRQARLKGPIRVNAAALGISTDELVRRLFAAKELDEIRDLADKLGAVGDDRTIEAVMPLLSDARSGVPEAIIGAFGVIATDHAVDVLIELARDTRDDVRIAAVVALAETHNQRGEGVISELAQHTDDPAQHAAIAALGQLASERSVEVLARIASHPNEESEIAVRALAEIKSPAARAALIALIDSPSVKVASDAIDELRDLDASLVAKLTAIVRSGGDRELIVPALGALGRAGEAGMPALREAALGGPLDLRVSAVTVLATVDSGDRLAILRTILENEEGRIADAAAQAASTIDSDDARELLISTALSDRANAPRAVEYLMRQTGPDVEQALLVIAKSDSSQRWDAVEHLVRSGNAEATAFATAQAHGGSQDQRLAAMEALAEAGTQPAIDTLVELARGGGNLKARALDLLGSARPEDPVVTQLLSDAVRSNNPEEAAVAAGVLGRVGTEEARDVLIAALASGDSNVVNNAASSLTKFRLTDEVTSALRSATAAHPELRSQVMVHLISAGSPAGLELARAALDNPESPHEAYRAISALEQSASPQAVELLSRAARASDPQVRAEAVLSLGYTGDKRATHLVAESLRDADPNVRASAARTLAQIGTTQARELLVNMTRTANREDRQAAVTHLRRFDDTDTTRRLTELLRDPDSSVAYSAIEAVADRPDARPALRSLALDGSIAADQRRQAATALMYRGVTDPEIEAVLDAE